MSNYSKTTDFAAKDSLPSGDSGKIIRGSEFETEFDNISTAIATKADAADPTFTGTVTIDGLTVNGNTVLGNAATDTVTVTADIASNLIPSADDTYNLGASGAEWNDLYVDGTAYIDDISGGSISGTSFASTGNMTFGDGNQAIFGAGSDLQIYHDGTDSLVRNSTGNLIIQDDNGSVLLRPKSGQSGLNLIADGTAALFYAGIQKLNTTSTGVDVTGTLVSDGLTVDNSGTAISITNGDGLTQLGKFSGESSNGFVIEGKSNNNLTLRTNANTLGEGIKFQDSAGDNMMLIDGTTGDISFYEDTGTTAKFFWDASAERLGIGETSPARALHVNSGTVDAGIRVESTDASSFIEFEDSTTTTIPQIGGKADDLVFRTNNAEAMRIDDSQNVGIGTDSPSKQLTVSALTDATLRLESTKTGTAAGNVMGALEYYGSDTSTGSAGVAGKIDVITEDTTPDYAMRFFTRDQASGGSLNEAMRIDSAGNVGIGTDSPGTTLHVNSGTVDAGIRVESSDTSSYIEFKDNTTTTNTQVGGQGDALAFRTSGSERMRLASGGTVMVGKTSSTSATVGVELRQNGVLIGTASGIPSLLLNRTTSDGSIVNLQKDGSTVGNIGVNSSNAYFASSEFGIKPTSVGLVSTNTSGVAQDGAEDLGGSSFRWKDLYLSGGAYLGGTAAANKLDDYEEGAWTPVVADANTGGNTATGSFSGRYTKVGNLVTVQAKLENINTTGMTSSNTLHITGLPFTSKGTNAGAIGGVQFRSITFSGFVTSFMGNSRTYMTFRESISGLGGSNLAVSGIASGTGDIYFTFSYEAA